MTDQGKSDHTSPDPEFIYARLFGDRTAYESLDKGLESKIQEMKDDINSAKIIDENISDETVKQIVIPIPPALNFLNHDFGHIKPSEIPGIVTNSPFNAAMNTETIDKLMSQPVNTKDVLSSLGFTPKQVMTLKAELREFASPKEILNELGFDSQQIVTELNILKDNLQLEGLSPYMKRAEELYSEITATKRPSLVIESDVEANSYKFARPITKSETSYVTNSNDVTLVTDLNEIIAKEQIKNQSSDAELLVDEQSEGLPIIDKSSEFDKYEIPEEQIELIESEIPNRIHIDDNRQKSNDSMLDFNNQALEISSNDSSSERVQLVKNIIDKAKLTIEGDMKSMEFNIKTEKSW